MFEVKACWFLHMADHEAGIQQARIVGRVVRGCMLLILHDEWADKRDGEWPGGMGDIRQVT